MKTQQADVDVSNIRAVGAILTGKDVSSQPLNNKTISALRDEIETNYQKQDLEAPIRKSAEDLAIVRLIEAIKGRDWPALRALLHVLRVEKNIDIREIIDRVATSKS